MHSNSVLRVGRLGRGPLGIMSDSHGNVEAVAAAMDLFDRNGCRRVVHLGDICDSETPETAGAVTRSLMRPGVLAVMGNNEHALVQRAASDTVIEEMVRSYMAALPLQIEAKGHVFIHNRPFPDSLGMSCLMGDITAEDWGRIDRRCRDVVLFRGHSHLPSVCHSRRGCIAPGIVDKDLDLGDGGNWVVTCGALETGWCMIWHPDQRVLSFRRL